MKSIQDRLSEKMYVITFKNLTSLCICQYSEGRSATLCKIKTVNMKAGFLAVCFCSLFCLGRARNKIVVYF